MCQHCYVEYGSPHILNRGVINAAGLVSRIYEYCSVGSNAHVVVDDWNIDDGMIDAVLRDLDDNFFEATPEQLEIERDALLALRALNENERASALAIVEGYFIG